MDELTSRECRVLETVIQSFIDSAIPIGSRYISKKFGYSLSSATIRNVMMDLEDKGYITQPYTSAGRIPTDKGYRFYVNGLMKIEDLSIEEKRKIERDLINVYHDVDKILEKACEVLCKISNLLGVVLSPRFFSGRFEKVELVKLSEHVLLVIISIKLGLVKTITMEIQSDIPKEKLEETANVLNQRLCNLTLKEIRETIAFRLKDVISGDEELLKQFVISADRLFIYDDAHIHISGTQNIVNQPEFADREKIQKILELIDNQKILIHIFNEFGDNEKISIIIGKENKKELMKNCSLITTTYNLGSVSGTLGIIGPTRMHYAKMISLVDYIAKGISTMFGK